MSVSGEFDKAARLIREAIAQGVEDAARDLLRRSNQVVPTDPGNELEKSGKVTTDGLAAAVSYDTEYAVIQHERMDYRHDPGRRAKFLEQSVAPAAAADAVADRVRRAIR